MIVDKLLEFNIDEPMPKKRMLKETVRLVESKRQEESIIVPKRKKAAETHKASPKKPKKVAETHNASPKKPKKAAEKHNTSPKPKQKNNLQQIKVSQKRTQDNVTKKLFQTSGMFEQFKTTDTAANTSIESPEGSTATSTTMTTMPTNTSGAWHVANDSTAKPQTDSDYGTLKNVNPSTSARQLTYPTSGDTSLTSTLSLCTDAKFPPSK